MSNAQFAGMPAVTNSELWPLRVVATGERAKARMKGERNGPQEIALSPDGRPTFSTGCLPRLWNASKGEFQTQRDYRVHVINATSEDVFEPGEYLADGLIWIMPYTPDGSRRYSLSITVEGLVSVTAPAASKAREAS